MFCAVHSSRAVLPSVARVSVMLRLPSSASVTTGDVALPRSPPTSPNAENGSTVGAPGSDVAVLSWWIWRLQPEKRTPDAILETATCYHLDRPRLRKCEYFRAKKSCSVLFFSRHRGANLREEGKVCFVKKFRQRVSLCVSPSISSPSRPPPSSAPLSSLGAAHLVPVQGSAVHTLRRSFIRYAARPIALRPRPRPVSYT